MGFFDRFFNRNPTADFPVPEKPVSLVWDTAQHHLNGIRLDSDFSALAPLGPCPLYRKHTKHRFNCDYPALGLEMQYLNNKLESITWFISEDENFPLPAGGQYASVRLEPSGVNLTPDMDADTLTGLFGKFKLMDKDEEEMIGTFFNGNMCYEAEFTPGARLKRLNLYHDV